MYESEITTPPLDPRLQEYQMMGHAGLRRQIVDAMPGLSDEEADLRVIAFWSAIYGFSSICRKGVIHISRGAVATVDIAHQIVHRAVLSALSA
ncbi:hypothetical protein [Sphingobium tyrosinilyticum]|uniref:Tetracyclin repressor-like C-terminal domain-containing protein n=1 Tax=Sphingobium tyrosinilyticum TaxID=2715436 RepID=A0ABV9F613_9SPHN